MKYGFLVIISKESGDGIMSPPDSYILFLSSHPFHFLIPQHLLVEFFLHPVKEVGTAFAFPAFDVNVEAVAVL